MVPSGNFTWKKVLKYGFLAILFAFAVFEFVKFNFFPQDTVDISEVEIKLHSGKALVKIGSSQNTVINALGKPKLISSFSSQTNYKQGTVFNYNGARFYFVHNKLSDFEITSHKYTVGLAGNHKFNSIGNTKEDLPHFKIERNTALLDVKKDDALTDQYLEYDLSDSGKVTKISYSDY